MKNYVTPISAGNPWVVSACPAKRHERAFGTTTVAPSGLTFSHAMAADCSFDDARIYYGDPRRDTTLQQG